MVNAAVTEVNALMEEAKARPDVAKDLGAGELPRVVNGLLQLADHPLKG